MSNLTAVSYGGGSNSTGLLVGLHERGERPDYITFADTGGEKPHTYTHLEYMQEWCQRVGFPEIVVCRKVDKNGEIMTLEENCLDRHMLPSLAYGFKTCSQKFKLQPQEKFFNHNADAKAVWEAGNKIRRLVGFDADEPHRAKEFDDTKYQNEYPLIEWGWGRDDCIDAIRRAGIPLPGKSACFFCPSSRQSEIRWLAEAHPDLMARAVAMEKNADLDTIKGLGRQFAWGDLIATSDMFPETLVEMACGCYD